MVTPHLAGPQSHIIVYMLSRGVRNDTHHANQFDYTHKIKMEIQPDGPEEDASDDCTARCIEYVSAHSGSDFHSVTHKTYEQLCILYVAAPTLVDHTVYSC